MLLKNFYAAIFAPSLEEGGQIPVDGGTKTYTRPNEANTQSVYKNIYNGLGFYGMNKTLSTSKTTCRAILGTGTTPPTFDDYDLSGSIIKTISSAVASTSKTVEEDGITIRTTWTVTNTGDAAITIGEVAFFSDRTSSASSSGYGMCIERTVLEEPITIEAGGVGQVTYTIRLKYPTA